jgi:hypothetical protein
MAQFSLFPAPAAAGAGIVFILLDHFLDETLGVFYLVKNGV